jgi:hypothetical protein
MHSLLRFVRIPSAARTTQPIEGFGHGRGRAFLSASSI